MTEIVFFKLQKLLLLMDWTFKNKSGALLKHGSGKFYEVQQFGWYRVDVVEVLKPETGTLHFQYFALHL